jgi:hypothetical protein
LQQRTQTEKAKTRIAANRSACRQSLVNAPAKAAEASRLLNLQLPSAAELERMVRSALATDPQSISEGSIMPPLSFESLEKA